MKEEFFSKIGWTRSFISGYANPVHNPLMVWCHICKKNFSIKSKGPYEILRHHRTQRHLRRDQRWRYEHLRSTDPVTGKVQHRVRGANGKVLSKMELAKALPHFINEELVDIGERFPFYDGFHYSTGHCRIQSQNSTLSRGRLCENSRRHDGVEEPVVTDGVIHQPSSHGD